MGGAGLRAASVWSMFSLRCKLDMKVMMVTSRLSLLVLILGEWSILEI